MVFVRELYASASVAGIIVLYVFYTVGIDLNIAAIAGITTVISIRLVAMRYRWNLPRARV